VNKAEVLRFLQTLAASRNVVGRRAGILMAIATTRLMTGLLFEVRALNAATFAAIASVDFCIGDH
jgi:hypothetical protein